MSTSATVSNARVSQDDARRSLAHVRGMTVERALGVLRFNPRHTCPPLERALCAALAEVRAATPEAGAADHVVLAGRVGDGDVVTRLRRHAHGDAYWLTTHTTSIEVEIAPLSDRDVRRTTDHGEDPDG